MVYYLAQIIVQIISLILKFGVMRFFVYRKAGPAGAG
jgi:hypothetical protein